MQELRRYVRSRWGGADLGILAKPPRAVRAGDTPSLHNWGIAWDWRWQDPGPGRQVADAVIEFCIANAEVLGIQAVHDYQGTRFWKSNAGWRTGNTESQDRHGPAMGTVVAHRANLAVGQPGDVDRGTARRRRYRRARRHRAAQAPAPPPDAVGQQRTILPTGPLRRGSVGADVGRLQDFLRQFGFADFTRSDGVFGPRTEAAVIKAQQALAAKSLYTAEIDGIWGPKTHAAATQTAGRPRPLTAEPQRPGTRRPASSRSLGGHGEHPRQADARRHRGALGRPVAGRRHLPLRRVGRP